MMWLKFSIGLLFVGPVLLLKAQLYTDTCNNAAIMASRLVNNSSVHVFNATKDCAQDYMGLFYNKYSNLGLDSSGIVLSTDSVIYSASPKTIHFEAWPCYKRDIDLDSALLYPFPHPPFPPEMDTSMDACVLEFDMIPENDLVQFRYVFGSEEYPAYVCSGVSDGFCFLVTGNKPGGGYYYKKNIALLPDTNLPISINSVNQGWLSGLGNPLICVSLDYRHLFVLNCDTTGSGNPIYLTDSFYVPLNGFTVPLIASINVVPCDTYHVKIVIGEWIVCDAASSVYIESLRSLPAVEFDSVQYTYGLPTAVEGCNAATVKLIVRKPQPENVTVHYSIAGSAINGTDYQWLTDSIVVPYKDTVAYIPITPIADGTSEGPERIVLYLYRTGCYAGVYDSAVIWLNDPPAFSAGGDVTACSGVSVPFNATPGMSSYLWQPAAGLSSTNTAQVLCSMPGSYTVSATYGLCSYTDTVIYVIGSAQLQLQQLVSYTGCGTSAAVQVSYTASGGVQPYTYQLLSVLSGNSTTSTSGVFNVLQGAYVLTVSDASGCADTFQLLYSAPLPDSFSIVATPVTCKGQDNGSVQVVSSTALYPPYQYAILFNGSMVATNNTGIFTGLSAGQYSAQITDAKQCTTLLPISITEVADSFSMTSSSPLCVGSYTGTIQIQNIIAVYPNYLYELLLGNNVLASNTNGIFNGLDAGTYTVRITDANQCATHLQDTLEALNNYQLQILPKDTTVYFGKPIVLQGVVSPYEPQGVWYQWQGTGIDCSACAATSVHPEGQYEMYILTAGYDSCTLSDTAYVHQMADAIVFIPNAFTPNGDGNNDVWQVFANSVKQWQLKVFNRWGEIVFESNSPQHHWDGLYKGQPLPQGVFVYDLQVVFIDHQNLHKKGSVTLLK